MNAITLVLYLILHHGGYLQASPPEKTGTLATQAQTLYVAPNGSDQNPGTASSPFRTFSKALSVVQGGDHIRLAAGVYREGELNVLRTGSASAPITIEGAGRDQTIIKGSQEVQGWVNHAPGVWKRGGWQDNSQQVFCDGEHLQQIGEGTPWHSRVMWAGKLALDPVGEDESDLFAGSFYYDESSSILYVMLKNQGDPNQHLMEASVRDYILHGKSSSHVTVKDLTLTHTNGSHDGSRSYVLNLGNDHWNVERCNITYGDYIGIEASGTYHTIRDCRISYAGDVGIDINNSNAANNWGYYSGAPDMHTTIEGCEISFNNYRKFLSEWHAGGMKLIPAIRGITITKNRVENNFGPGIWLDQPLGENAVTHNYVAGNEQGIFVEIQEGEPSMSFGTVVCNNWVVNNSFQGIYVSASSDVVVENNTVVDNWFGIVAHGMPRGSYTLENNIIRNNLILGGSGGDMIIFNGTDAVDNYVDQNYYAIGTSTSPSNPIYQHIRVGVVTGGGYNINFSSLQSLASQTSFEQNGQEGNPQWVPGSTHNLGLSSNSPAQGKGASTNGPCEALSGSTFPVELINFRAEALPDAKGTRLRWETTWESENNYFQVEKGIDGEIFSPIGHVEAKGNGTGQWDYWLDDPSPLEGKVYYRLKQVDWDGSFTYSRTLEFYSQEETATIMEAFPIPLSPGTPLKVELYAQTSEVLTLKDPQGKLIRSISYEPHMGRQQLQLDTTGLSKGVYFLEAQHSRKARLLLIH